jgi:hypothetical protein
MKPTCVICGAADARPREGHRYPMCSGCRNGWDASAERARAATALDDYVRRRRLELAQEHAAKKVQDIEDL